MADSNVPPEFAPLFRTSPFLELVGPLYYRRDTERGLIVAFRVEPKHANARGLAHGGALLTLADVALGYAAAFSVEPPAALVTTNISADFAGAARVGDWVEAHVDVQRLGTRMAFANAYLTVGERRITRVSAVFARDDEALQPT